MDSGEIYAHCRETRDTTTINNLFFQRRSQSILFPLTKQACDLLGCRLWFVDHQEMSRRSDKQRSPTGSGLSSLNETPPWSQREAERRAKKPFTGWPEEGRMWLWPVQLGREGLVLTKHTQFIYILYNLTGWEMIWKRMKERDVW